MRTSAAELKFLHRQPPGTVAITAFWLKNAVVPAISRLSGLARPPYSFDAITARR